MTPNRFTSNASPAFVPSRPPDRVVASVCAFLFRPSAKSRRLHLALLRLPPLGPWASAEGPRAAELTVMVLSMIKQIQKHPLPPLCAARARMRPAPEKQRAGRRRRSTNSLSPELRARRTRSSALRRCLLGKEAMFTPLRRVISGDGRPTLSDLVSMGRDTCRSRWHLYLLLVRCEQPQPWHSVFRGKVKEGFGKEAWLSFPVAFGKLGVPAFLLKESALLFLCPSRQSVYGTFCGVQGRQLLPFLPSQLDPGGGTHRVCLSDKFRFYSVQFSPGFSLPLGRHLRIGCRFPRTTPRTFCLLLVCGFRYFYSTSYSFLFPKTIGALLPHSKTGPMVNKTSRNSSYFIHSALSYSHYGVNTTSR